MTCRLISGFEDLPASGLNETRLGASGYYWYASGDVMPAMETGRFGYGQCMHFNVQGFSPPTVNMVRMLGVEVSQAWYGFAYKWEPTTIGYPFVTFFDAVAGLPCFTVNFSQMGVIRVWSGYPATTSLLISSAPGSFTQSQWFYCEVGTTISSTSGTVEVRVNTVPVIQLVAANTNGAGRGVLNAVSFGSLANGVGANCEYRIDDMYVNDAAGSVNNGFLGNVRVKTQFAASAGDSTQFAIGGSSPAPTNWQSVLNQNLDDSKYVFDSTVGDEDLYHVQAIINSSSLVHAVQVSGGYRMDDSTQRVARNALKSGGVVSTGSDHYINQTYTMYRDIWELDPSTGVSFTGAGANGMQIGTKVEA